MTKGARGGLAVSRSISTPATGVFPEPAVQLIRELCVFPALHNQTLG